MKTIYAILCLLCLMESALRAEIQTIQIPHQKFVVRVDCPSLGLVREEPRGDEFTFRGVNGNFSLSLFVENPSGGLAHRDCFEFYWKAVLQVNPQIRKDSIKIQHTGDYSRVEYVIEVPGEKKPVKQKHVNYYIAYQRKWMDLHIKYVGYEPKDEKIFKAFDAGLNYTGKKE